MLQAELDWLERLVLFRMDKLLDALPASSPEGPAPQPSSPPDPHSSSPPDPPTLPPYDGKSAWAPLLEDLAKDYLARIALALALAAQLRPSALDPLQLINPHVQRRFSEAGGTVRDDVFEPNGETLALLFDGGCVAGRLAVVRLLAADGLVRRLGLLGPVVKDAPLRVSLRVPGPWLEWLAGAGDLPETTASTTTDPGAAGGATGLVSEPLQTAMAWSDLVLPGGTLRQLEVFEHHLRHDQTLRQDWGMARWLRPGYRALFHGPPGTGKTLTAALLGRRMGLETRRVDLSRVVSKYIGETEKELAALLDRAERSRWLLLFDEADVLFSQRTESNDAHDRYANQEVAYLLQRLDTFSGVVVLATNLPANIDGAFLRRFETVVYFPMPGPEQRLRFWREAFSSRAKLEVDLQNIAERYEISGGLILNIVRQVSMQSIAQGEAPISEKQLLEAIRRELDKDGKGL